MEVWLWPLWRTGDRECSSELQQTFSNVLSNEGKCATFKINDGCTHDISKSRVTHIEASDKEEKI